MNAQLQNDKVEEFDNSLLYEQSKKAQSCADGSCHVCERQGFPLFLVRKTIVPKTFKPNITWSAGMDNSKAIVLDNYHYAYRTLREGYVYILAEKNKEAWPEGTSNELDIIAYEVTHSGAYRLREFRDIKGSRPKEIPKTQCYAASHHLKGKFITLNNTLYQKVWIAYSFTRWSMDTITHYQQNSDDLEKRFIAVDMTKTTPSDFSTNGRSFAFDDFTDKKRHLLELECDSNSVSDYFDEQEQQEKNNPDNFITKLRNDNRKGIFESVELKSLLTKNKEGIFEHFSHKFVTAHHFNSLINSDKSQKTPFKKTVDDYQVDNFKITVLELDDSFAIAEELSIQKRQLLSPIINEFLQSDDEKLQLLKEKYDVFAESFTKDNLQAEEKKKMEEELAQFYRIFYSQNILDMDHNRKYKELDELFKSSPIKPLLYLSPIGYLVDKIPYYRARKRAEGMVDFFNSIKVENHPLSYFKPEISYARKQKSQIDAYKQMLLTSKESELLQNDIPCRVFAFYNSKQRDFFDPIYRQEQIAQFISHGYKGLFGIDYNLDETDERLDNFDLVDVFGLQELAKYFDIPYSRAALENSRSSGYVFKRLKHLGMSEFMQDSPPLGDYKIIDIDPKQKTQILAQYKQLNINTPRAIDDVYVVEFTQAREKVAAWKAQKQWTDKHQPRIYSESEKTFSQIDKLLFNNLITYVKDISTDYFKYCSWLFGTTYPFAFWRYECQPDLGDSHINYLYSLAIILDCNYMGNIQLDEQDAFFASLFRDKTTIYFHLLEGHQYSLFNVASGAIEEQELTTQVKNILFATTNAATTTDSVETPEIIKQLEFIKDNHQYITGLTLKNNVTVGAYLTGEIVQVSLSKATRQLTKGIDITQKNIINENIIKSMNAFSPGIVRQYTIKVPIDKVSYVIQDIEHNFTKLVQNNTTQVTNIKMLNRNYKNGLSGQKYSGVTTRVTTEMVEYSYYGYFESHDERSAYEKKLKYVGAGEKAGTDKLFICDATKATEAELNEAFNYVAGLEKRKAIVDTTIATIFSGITIISQYYQLAELEARLKNAKSNQSYQKLKRDIAKAHINMVITFSEIVLNLAKYSAIYLAKQSLYKLLDKMIGKINKISNLIAIVDSLGTYLDASKALTRGDEGSNVYYITSAIGLTVAIAGMVGAISLPVTIIIGLCVWLISLLADYDDGSTWDSFDKWLNCTMLGKFGRNDLFPPYPITDTGLYLSDQDFYLASQGGQLNLLSIDLDYETKMAEHEANQPLPSSDFFAMMAEAGKTSYDVPTQYHRPEGESYSKGPYSDLYLSLSLPDFVRGVSTFEGSIEISHRYSSTKTIFNFSDGDEYLDIKPFTASSRDYLFAEPGDGMIRIAEENYKYKQEDSQRMNIDLEWLAIQKIVEPSLVVPEPATHEQKIPEIGLFQIDQLLGRIDGAHYVRCYVNYWPQGKMDENDQPRVPFLYAHQHNVNNLAETISDYFGEHITQA